MKSVFIVISLFVSFFAQAMPLEVFTIQNSEKLISSKFSPTGKHILTVLENKIAKIYDLEGRLISKISLGDYNPNAEFSREGNHILTYERKYSGSVENIKVFNLLGQMVFKDTNRYGNVKISPDGSFLAVYSSSFQLIDLKTGNKFFEAEYAAEFPRQYSIFISNDGKTIVVKNRHIRYIYQIQGRSVTEINVSPNVNQDFFFTPIFSLDNQYVVDSKDIYNTKTGKLVFSFPWDADDQAIQSLQISPDSKYAVALTAYGKIYYYNFDTKKFSKSGNDGGSYNHSEPRTPEFSHNSQYILFGSTKLDSYVSVYDIQNLSGTSYGPFAQFSPTEESILTGYERMIKIVDLKNQTTSLVINLEKSINSARFSGNGNLIVLASKYEISIYDLKGKLVKLFDYDIYNRIDQIEFDPAGKFIMTSGNDNSLKVIKLFN